MLIEFYLAESVFGPEATSAMGKPSTLLVKSFRSPTSPTHCATLSP
jgi:hypothetical protein